MWKSPTRRYLIAGLLVWIPIWATVLVIHFLVQLMDSTLSFLPDAYQPEVLLGHHIPGLGLVISLAVVLFTGLLVTNYLGHKLVAMGESVVARIPLVRSIYKGVKQVMETLLSSGSESFRKALLIQYPREGMWAIGFATGVAPKEIRDATGKKNLIMAYIPTTPNPTSGFLIMVPKEEVIELSISIDEALKMVISLGVINQPVNKEILGKTAIS